MKLTRRVNTLFAQTQEVQANTGNQTRMGAEERRKRPRLDARKGTRVLVIEDSTTALSMITNMFSTAGYEVAQSNESERGLYMACYSPPELVILNVGMPGMNGFEVLKRMRKDPVARRIPVIMTTGNQHAIDHFYKRNVDADAIIKKPFTRYEVFSRVEKMLSTERVPMRANDIRSSTAGSFLARIRQSLLRGNQSTK